jgi:phenylpyruvate tautomerase PptA (4-oxalocrotonate tautomerase family)
MPLVTVDVIKNVFSPAQKEEIIRKATGASVASS